MPLFANNRHPAEYPYRIHNPALKQIQGPTVQFRTRAHNHNKRFYRRECIGRLDTTNHFY